MAAVRVALGWVLVLTLGWAATGQAQQVDASFQMPLFWEKFTEHTLSTGPDRSVSDGAGGVYMVGNGGADVVNGLWHSEPIRFFETNGLVDTSFQSALKGAGGATAIQADGKLLVTYWTESADAVCRLLPSGAVDPSFTPAGFSQGIRHLLVLPGGKILVVISGNPVSQPGPLTIAAPPYSIYRLNHNGQVDASFSVPEFNGFLYAPPAVDSSENIYVGGAFSTVNGVSCQRLARLLPNGDLDPNFPAPGAIPGGLGGNVRALAVQSSGKVVVSGDLRIPATAPSSERTVAIRFLWTGELDNSFQQHKVGQVFPGDYPRAMAMLPDDRFVVLAKDLVQFEADGGIDFNFSRVERPIQSFWVTRLSDGRWLIPAGDPENGASVFSALGVPDTSFVTGGFGRATAPSEVEILTDGRAVLCGQFNRVASCNQWALSIHSAETGQLLLSQPDLQTQVANSAYITSVKAEAGPTNTCWFVAEWRDTEHFNHLLFGRVLADGSLDPGMPVQDWTGTTNFASELVGLAGGQLLVLDNTAQGAVNGAPVRRLLADGTPDPAFALAQSVVDKLAEVAYAPGDYLEVVNTGELRLLGSWGTNHFLAAIATVQGGTELVRMAYDGSLDPGFASPEFTDPCRSLAFFSEFINPRTGFPEQPMNQTNFWQESFLDAAELSDGKMLVGGRFSELGGVTTPCLARLSTNGTVDATFGGVLLQYTANPFWLPRLTSLEIDEHGRIYVAGVFDRINNVAAPGLARLLPDGNVDTSFQSPIDCLSHIIYGVPRLKIHGDYLYVIGASTLGGTNSMGCRIGIGEELRLPPASLAGNRLDFTIPADPVKPTVLQVSEDFVNWVGVATNAPGTLPAAYSEMISSTAQGRFYRLKR